MEFIDNTGHIFSLPSYDSYPYGYEYESNPYIFWIDEEYNNRLSVNNYYVKCIRVLIDFSNVEKYEDLSVEISVDSNIFKLISSKYIHDNINNISKGFSIDETDFTDTLIYNSEDEDNSTLNTIEGIEEDTYINISWELANTLDKKITIYTIKDNEYIEVSKDELNINESYYILSSNKNKYAIIPFYVVANSPEEGSWSSNIIIHTYYKSYYIVSTKTVKKEITTSDITIATPMFFRSVKDGSSIKLECKDGKTRTIYISYDNINWEIWDLSQEIILNKNQICYFKSENPNGFNNDIGSDNIYSRFNTNGELYLGGNIMSLVHKDDFETNNTIPFVKCFYWLFNKSLGIISAKNLILPATELTTRCYFQMFSGCTNLVNPPFYLPASTIEQDSYNSMFAGCTSLISTPLIQCDTLKLLISGVANMFGGCTSLKTIFINVDYIDINNDAYNIRQFFNDVPSDGTFYTKIGNHWVLDNTLYSLNGQSKTLKDWIIPSGWVSKEIEDIDSELKESLDLEYETIIENIYSDFDFNDDYCYVTVGGQFIDESEELIINGQNMGINLPKDIIKAIYQSSFYNSYIDESLYNEKIKEYLFNYMNIKGECGNFKSAINSLKWFGWGNKITISKLLKNDNEFINQYLLDNFEISNDTPNSSKYFKNTSNISLQVHGNIESGEYTTQNIDYSNNNFWGEESPILKDLFNEVTEVKKDNLIFYKSFYDYTFNEIGLKLSCLIYYYKKYFLPIHLKIHSATINYKTYANDVKFLCEGYANITEVPHLVVNNHTKVNININDTLYFYNSIHYVDDNFNEFKYITNNQEYNFFKYLSNYDDTDYYKIDDTCLEIPIEFLYDNQKNGYFNCHAVLINATENKLCFESNFSFYQSEDNININVTKNGVTTSKNLNILYDKLIIYPKYLETTNKYDYHDWVDNTFELHICCNNTWFRKQFKISFAETYIDMGKLEYNYSDKFTQLDELTNTTVTFKSYINEPQFIIMDDINYISNLSKYYKDEDNYDFTNELKKYISSVNINSLNKYYNKIYVYNIFANGEELKYDPNENYTDLYNKFFKNDIDTNGNKIITQNIYIDYNVVKYDLYIMHEEYIEGSEAHWYAVFISKDTMNLPDSYYINDKSVIQFSGYTLKLIKSDKKFLINRMNFKSTNGVNHFTKSDIILAKLNNDKLAFNYNNTSKWEIMPYSLGMNNTLSVYSNNNIAIVNIPENKYNYVKGIYNIKVNYCVDSYSNNSFTKNTIFKID